MSVNDTLVRSNLATATWSASPRSSQRVTRTAADRELIGAIADRRRAEHADREGPAIEPEVGRDADERREERPARVVHRRERLPAPRRRRRHRVRIGAAARE